MQVVTSASEQNGLSVLLFHCFFNGYESITHFMHDLDPELYECLPNLYAVCVAETFDNHKKVTAGFVVKTSYTHNDPDFVHALRNVVSTDPRLERLANPASSFLPARLGLAGETPPTEEEMLHILTTQGLKYGVAGRA